MSDDGGLERVIGIVCTVGGVSEIGADQDFYEAGVSSIAALSLLMELETAFEVSIPDDAFVNARTARGLHDTVTRLRQESGAGR